MSTGGEWLMDWLGIRIKPHYFRCSQCGDAFPTVGEAWLHLRSCEHPPVGREDK